MTKTPLAIRSTGMELAQPFDELIAATLRQVAASSARIYGQTYSLWRAWCLVQQIDPFDLRPANVLAFLGAQSVVKSTRQRQLSALRKLAQMLYILAPSEATRCVVKATEAACGIAFKPHDLRRTFITEALATGTPLATVQAAAGHARGETTLRYAQAVDARTARKALKLRYG